MEFYFFPALALFLPLIFEIINCSHTKFVAIIIILWFIAIFHLNDFSSDLIDFLFSKTGQTGSARGALSSLRALSLTVL